MVETIGCLVGTSTQGTSVTPSATAAVKGSYAQLTAATSFDYCGFWIMVDNQNASDGNVISTDIAIGTSGSELVVLPDWVTNMGIPQGAYSSFIPLRIPAGTRIAARSMSNAASNPAVGVAIYGVSL